MKNPWAKLASYLPFTDTAGSTPRPRRTRVGARSSAILLSAILVAAPLVAVVQPTPAVAADPTSGNVEMQTTIAYDGTGHNTVDKCWISGGVATELGMIGDNSPNDGVVCSNDAVAWELNFNVAASPTATVVAVTEASPLPTGLDRGGNWNNWCSATSPITAVLSGGTCTFTIPANTSTTLTTVLPYTTAESKVDVAPTYTMTVNGSAATTVPTDKVTIVSAPAFDLEMDLGYPDGSGISYVEIDNVAYAKYSLTNTLAPNFLDGADRGGPGDKPKGYSGLLEDGSNKWVTRLSATGTLDVSSLPTGSQIRTNDGVLHLASDGPITTELNVHDGPSGTYKTIEVLVPVTALTSTQTYTIQAYDVSVTSPTALYPSNFNGATKEPGDGQAINYPTFGRFGSTTYPGNAKAGRTDGVTGAVANNDWARMRFPAPAALGLNAKSVWPANTRPGGSVTATVNAGTTPKTYASGEFTLCDEWKPGEQFLDASKQHVVTARVAGEAAPRVLTASEYHLEYGTAALAKYGSGCTDSATNWVGVAAADANVVRVVFDVSVNLLGGPIGNQTRGAQWQIPLIAGPAGAFPTFPSSTPVSDQATVSANGTHDRKSAFFRVAGPVLRIQDLTSFHAPGASTLPGMTEIGPGVTGQVTFSSMTYWQSNVPGDNLAHTVTTTATLSSCAIEPHVVSSAANADGVTITPPDLGPDGLACTADDGIGWKFTWTTERNPSNGNSVTTGVTVAYTVPDYAKTGTNITGSTASTATAVQSGVPQVSAPSSDTVVVGTNAALGQQKLRDTVRTMAGNPVGWTLAFFNYSPDDQSGVEFIDVLPYVGDGRGTTGILSSVALSNISSINDLGGTVYVTNASPSSIPKDTANIDPGDPGFNDKWCEYGMSTCPIGGGQITGIYVYFATMAKDSLATLRVTAATEGSLDEQKLVNNLGKGSVAVVGALPIPATQDLVTVLYLNEISGTVYRDSDKDGTRDAGEAPVAGVTVNLWPKDAVGAGSPLETATTASDGTYRFTDLKDGDFVVQIVNPDGSVITQAWTVKIGDDPAPTEKAPAATLLDSDQGEVDFGLWQEPKPTGPELPMTGGTGVALLTLAGVGVLSVALIPSIRRRKAQSVA